LTGNSAGLTPHEWNRCDSRRSVEKQARALSFSRQTRYACRTFRPASSIPSSTVNEARIMKPYVFSLLAGILAGVVYGGLGVHSPAPPAVALTGLLGMLAGEQLLPVARRMRSGLQLRAAWRDAKCTQHLFGRLPGAQAPDGGTPERRS
jgi:XapX domain-containing protein